MHKRGKVLRGRRATLTVAVLAMACLALLVSPAQAAVAGAGCDTTLDSRTGQFVTGCGSYSVTPGVDSSTVTVQFECYVVAGPDATQTRIRPAWENGCVLYAGGTAFRAAGQSAPGPASATAGTARVNLDGQGRFSLCWNVSATYIFSTGLELQNSNCTIVNI